MIFTDVGNKLSTIVFGNSVFKNEQKLFLRKTKSDLK